MNAFIIPNLEIYSNNIIKYQILISYIGGFGVLGFWGFGHKLFFKTQQILN